jgi:hypothetical protein
MTDRYDVLAVAAHPDDLEAVMGGTAAKLVDHGLRRRTRPEIGAHQARAVFHLRLMLASPLPLLSDNETVTVAGST